MRKNFLCVLERTLENRYMGDARMGGWPFQKTIAIELDSLQCQMLGKSLTIPRLTGESDDAFYRRRKRIIRETAATRRPHQLAGRATQPLMANQQTQIPL